MSVSPMRQADRPADDRQRRGARQHGPAAAIDAAQFEAAADVPPQMPEAVAQMVEQRDAPAEQQQKPDPRAEKMLDRGIGLGPIGSGAEPPHQQDRAEAQRHASRAVQDRHHRGQLPAIDLQMRRQWPLGGAHAQGSGEIQADCDLDRAPRSVNATGPWIIAAIPVLRPSSPAALRTRHSRTTPWPACPGHPRLQAAAGEKKTWVPGTVPGTGQAIWSGRFAIEIDNATAIRISRYSEVIEFWAAKQVRLEIGALLRVTRPFSGRFRFARCHVSLSSRNCFTSARPALRM